MQRGLNNEVQPVAVEIYFRGVRMGESALFHIERVWQTDMREELHVDEETFQREEFENYVETLGVTYTNSYHIVQQGRIEAIARMDDFELYQLLESAAGLRKYEHKREEAMEQLRRNAAQKKEINDTLQDIESKFKTYEARKEEFDLHHYEELAHKLRTKQED